MNEPTGDPSELERAAPLFRDLQVLARTLEPALRTRLVDEWSLAARFEHASIASFNQFSLQLLALGAPADLVAATNLAALQEVEHARAAFAVASAYAGRGIGPGPLAVASQLESIELLAVTTATVRDGCVEETLAAAEAAEAERRATVPAVRWVLARVAREERQHAALAYRFVAWACGVGGDPVRHAARETFRDALAAARTEPAAIDTDDGALLEPHGCLAPATRAQTRSSALTHLLEPTYEELFRG